MLKGIKPGTKVVTRDGAILEFIGLDSNPCYCFKYGFKTIKTGEYEDFLETGEYIGPNQPTGLDIVEILKPVQEQFSCTKIDYEGCDPDIKEALINGYFIECYVSNESGEDAINIGPLTQTKLVVAYYKKHSHWRYITTTGTSWKYAVPVKRKLYNQ